MININIFKFLNDDMNVQKKWLKNQPQVRFLSKKPLEKQFQNRLPFI